MFFRRNAASQCANLLLSSSDSSDNCDSLDTFFWPGLYDFFRSVQGLIFSSSLIFVESKLSEEFWIS